MDETTFKVAGGMRHVTWLGRSNIDIWGRGGDVRPNRHAHHMSAWHRAYGPNNIQGCGGQTAMTSKDAWDKAIENNWYRRKHGVANMPAESIDLGQGASMLTPTKPLIDPGSWVRF